MRFTHVLPLAALSAAIVIPDEQVLADLAAPRHQPSEEHHEGPKSFLDKLPCSHHLFQEPQAWIDGFDKAKNAIDHVIESIEDVFDTRQQDFVDSFDTDAWLEGTDLAGEQFDAFDADKPPHPPHRGPPGHGPPGHGPPHDKKPKHPPHHHKPNKTIYELISESKYTTVLAKLVANDSELVEVLNSTKANFTLFAPTDHAFSKIPEHAPKPSKEFIREVLLYHVSPGFYPAGRLVFSHTAPTLHNETLLGDKPQRLVAKVGLRGISINFYSKVVAANIPATNGIIHGVDSIIIPPPKTLKVLELLPSEFSTLLLGLGKTGLVSELSEATTVGGTFFAPPNGAFKKLGPRINAFLFSKYGEKYLKALLKYQIVANETLYTTAFYGPNSASLAAAKEDAGSKGHSYFHYDLPTLLDDKSLAVDVTQFGPWTTIKINGFTRVVVQDGITKDGVIQVVNNVLIPPKTPHGLAAQYWQGEEMSVEDFKERLGPLVSNEETNFDL